MNWNNTLIQIEKAIKDFDLNLSGLTVLTEAASGPYCVTPFIAALAGAKKVYACVKDNRFATRAEVEALFESLKASDMKISVIPSPHPDFLSDVDIVTNSGNLRPIDQSIIPHLKHTSVISLMYEKWERREEDINLKLCEVHKIRLVAPLEFKSTVGFGKDLKEMALFGIGQLKPKWNTIGVICDNEFKESLLEIPGAREVLPGKRFDQVDCLILARTPRGADDYRDVDFSLIGCKDILQFWGNINRARLSKMNIYPPIDPKLNHMGVLPSDIGEASVIKLQAAGLKVAELCLRGKSLQGHGEYVLGPFN